jgi:RNA-directed DNA polymerase
MITCQRVPISLLIVFAAIRFSAGHVWAATELREGLSEFGRKLNLEKIRLIEFGHHAAKNRHDPDEGKPETLNFLGFIHICGKTRGAGFIVIRQTSEGWTQANLNEVKRELRKRLQDHVPGVGDWLRSVVVEHLHYMRRP